VSAARSGAGGIRRRLRIRRIVDAPAMPELAQFTLDALVAPGRVLSGQLFDQRGDGVVEGWATGAVRVGPFVGHQVAVPAQDRGRGD
jgi:hypothetical protein